MTRMLQPAIVLVLGLLLTPIALNSAPPAAGADMSGAASAFLASLTPDQRTKATFTFDSPDRFDFHFIPRARKGLPLKEMTEAQREKAHVLLKTGLSQRGYATAATIISLENVLRATEKPRTGANAIVRDPELYFVSIFGSPAGKEPWGWRWEGHHLSFNFAVVDGKAVSWAPSFFGSNPARHENADKKMVAPLLPEEEEGRALIKMFDEATRTRAIFEAKAPNDIATGANQKVDPLAPVGITMKEMSSSQKRQLEKIIDVYLGRVATDIGKARLEKLQKAGMDAITFGWAGSLEVGQGHYYRVQGPTFLIEYDNTQNNNNHIHSIWRDFEGDFGRDILREHYKTVAH
jgi:hypothetical protein